jgi:hypothetical protein
MKTSPMVRIIVLVHSAFWVKGTLIILCALARGLGPIYAHQIDSIIAVSFKRSKIGVKNYLYTSVTVTAGV